jgi:hypothetical protein
LNAQAELLDFISGKPEVLCLTFARDVDCHVGPYTTGTLEEILPLLDFDYDSGFGSQELYGTIWFADGSWATRDEYDGSEWWGHRTPPALPERFQ